MALLSGSMKIWSALLCVCLCVPAIVMDHVGDASFSGSGVIDLIIDIVPSTGQLNATEGDNLTITVEVFGIPISTTWTFGHNGLRVANSEKYLIQEDFPVVSLTILDVREYDAGTYFLTVSGNSESVIGRYDVEVQVPPKFLENPSNITDIVLEVVQLICTATGFPLPNIVWLKGDNEVIEDSELLLILDLPGRSVISSVLIIEELNIVTAGEYYCNATNDLVTPLSTMSEKAFVNVLYPPNVTVTPSDELTVNVTFNATLTCTVFAIPLPNITWIKDVNDSVVSEETGRVSITEIDSINIRTSVLSFSSSLKSDESSYTCVATNDIENVLNTPTSATINLIVQVPADVMPVTQSPLTVLEGQSITLIFTITNDDPLVQVNNIQWEFGTVDITELSMTDEHYELSDDRLSLTINHVSLSADQGIYTLSATNEAGIRSASIEIIIESPPIIFITPTDQTVLETDSVTFRCLGTADPDPNVTWSFNGEQIIPIGRYSIGDSGVLFGSLTINDVVYTDQGTYTCTYENIRGSISISTLLTVQVRPMFSSLIVPINGTAGDSVLMTCNSTGVPTPTITWLKDNSSLSPSPGKISISTDDSLLPSGISSITSSLQIQELVLSDTSNYSCKAVNDLARPQTEVSQEEELIILYPPAVSVQPVALTVNQSDMASFTCEAFGIPLPLILWYFNDSSDPLSSDQFQIQNSTRVNSSGLAISMSTLTITSTLRSSHEGSYTCQAINNVNNLIGTPESAMTSLTVQVPPRVLIDTDNPLGVVNQSVTLTFSIIDAFPQVILDNIQWMFNDTVINNFTEPLLLEHIFSPDLLSLTLTNVQHSDQGYYSLTATNEAGTNTASVFLEVEAAPVIITPPSNELQLEGNDVMFECQAIAEPIHSVEWMFKNQLLDTESNKYSIDSTGELTISNVQLNDTGLYTCTVSNIHGNASASANLTVQVIPQFIQSPEGSVQLIGESVTINCSSFAVPSAILSWLKDGDLLDTSSPLVNVTSSTESSITSSQLTLTSLNFTDTGNYSCNATNNLVSEQVTTSSTAEIIVNMPVELQISPMNSTVNETDEVEYTCVAVGLPAPSFIWRTPQQPNLSVQDNLNIINTETPSDGAILVRSVLRFGSIQDTDANLYTCTASNTPRDTIQTDFASFQVTVQTQPVVMFTSDNDTVVGVELRDIQLTFNISRDLPPVRVEDIQWLFQQQGESSPVVIIPGEQPGHYMFSDDRLSLTINILMLNDSGNYTVEASNIVGTGSASVFLDVQKAPVIIVPLMSLQHLSSSDAIFTCEAQANPQHTIEWTKDGVQLFNSSKYLITGLGSSESILTIFNLQLNDAGNYTCFAENIHGNDSTTAELRVQVPPDFIVFPNSVAPPTLVAGGDITITCNVTGFPLPDVDILKDGIPFNLQDDTLDITKTDGILDNGELYRSISVSLYQLTFNDAAKYSCNATNNLASPQTRNSTPAIYTVQYPPDVSVSPTNLTVNETDSLTFYCQVFAIPVPDLFWINETSQMMVLSSPEGVMVTIGNLSHPSGFPITTSNLSIVNVQKQHESNYTCVAINNVTNLLNTPENGTISLTVQVPPIVVPEITSILVLVNRTVSLSFSITRASPEVELSDIQWSFTNGDDITEDITNINNSRLDYSDDMLTLTIYNISHDDEGLYTLTASNPAGIHSAAINLSVEAAPVFLQVPTNSSRLQGETAIFNCSAVAEPLHSIRWEINGKPIAQYLSPDDREESVLDFVKLNSTETGVNVTVNDNKYLLMGEGPLYGQLSILNTDLSDALRYTCIVANVHGNLSATASLTVQVTPTFPGKEAAIINASAGQSITIVCNTEGLPHPNVTWYKDGEVVIEEEEIIISENSGERNVNSTLTILSVIRVDDGVYWCNATNFLFVEFESMSPTTTLTVYYPPDVTDFPVSLQRNAAEYAVFSCTVTGLPIPTVQWSRTPSSQILSQQLGKFDISTQIDNSSLTGPHSVTTQLIVLNLTITDQETYTCSGLNPLNIENFIGAQSNALASLFVNVPPFVSATTSSPSVALWGRRFRLTFIITGFPTITPDNITWEFLPDSERDLETLSSSDRHVFSDNRHSLTLNPVRLEDAGRYRLTATNNGGTATAYIDISVLVEPEINENGDLISVSIGSRMTFTCTADGIPTPSLTWYRNGTLLTDSERWIITQTVGPGFRSEIPTTESIMSNLTLVNVRESDDFSQLSCRADNRIGEADVLSPPYVIRIEDVDDPCSPNPCLNDGTCFSSSDSNPSYICVCVNGYTETNCQTLYRINDYIPPSIIVRPRPSSVSLFSPVNLTCVVQGNPVPHIQWYKDGTPINDEHFFNLLISELTIEGRGWYHCAAVSNRENGVSETVSSPPVLVTINNIAQYLMSATVSMADDDSTQQIKSVIDQMNDILVAEMVSPKAQFFTSTLYNQTELVSDSQGNTTFETIVTLLTEEADSLLQQQLFDILESTGALLTHPITVNNVTRFDGCISEVTSFSSSIYWPETNLGSTIELDCPCGDLSLGEGRPIATRTCSGDFISRAIWNTPSDSVCEFEIQEQELCDITQLPVTSMLSALDVLSTNVTSSTELLIATALLENLTIDAIQDLNRTSVLLDVIENILSVKRDILQTAQQSSNVSSRILQILERVAEGISFSQGSSTAITRSSFIIAAQQISATDTNATFSALFEGMNEPTVQFIPVNGNVSVTIHLPQSLIDSVINMTGSVRLAHVVLRDGKLFMSDSTLASSVLGTSVVGGYPSQSISPPVNITFSVNQTALTTGSEVCSFWDFTLNNGQGDWSSAGCNLIFNGGQEEYAVCMCDHLTHFAITVDTDIPESLETEDRAVSVLTVILVVISLIFFVISFVMHIISPKLRTKVHVKLFLNSSAAFILLYIIYIGAMFAQDNTSSCIVFSALLHYAFLVVLTAMLLESSFQFFKQVWKSPDYYPIIAVFITWTTPILVVLFCVAPAHYLYATERYCQPRGVPLYLGVIVPFIIITLLSWTMLIYTIIVLLKKKPKLILKVQLISPLITSLLFTFGWIFVLPQVNSSNQTANVLEGLFWFTGGVLGFYVFLLYCIASSNVRAIWHQILCHSKPPRVHEDEVSLEMVVTKDIHEEEQEKEIASEQDEQIDVVMIKKEIVTEKDMDEQEKEIAAEKDEEIDVIKIEKEIVTEKDEDVDVDNVAHEESNI